VGFVVHQKLELSLILTQATKYRGNLPGWGLGGMVGEEISENKRVHPHQTQIKRSGTLSISHPPTPTMKTNKGVHFDLCHTRNPWRSSLSRVACPK
jgi:hypothetical protein